MPINSFSFNLIELGHIAAHLAMAVAIIQALAPLAARWLKDARIASIGVSATIAVFVLTSIGGATIIHAFVTSNFSVKYVATHSNLALPMLYKVTALWGGHEGSLYLWAWILSLFAVVIAWQGRRRYPEHLPVILAIKGVLIVGFYGLILYLSSPFERYLPEFPSDGRDLNPILQDPGLAFHPPFLYLGYVGYSVPFAFAIAALLTRWKSELWVGLTRRWALIAWGFLTMGIVLGGWWAYYELGWGGYWGWDPVENASFMPWLIGTALIHSITVQERRRMLHTWNLFLVISAFALSLLGTFLVRSGILSSVHAFNVDPGRGIYILSFMVLVLAASFMVFMALGRYQQSEETVSSYLSREAMFVINNILFLFACIVVMWGTLSPLLIDFITGNRPTVGAPFFNTIVIPVFFLILLLMGLATQVPWRKARPDRLMARLILPAIGGLLVLGVVLVLASPVHWFAPLGLGIVAFVAMTIFIDYGHAVAQRQRQQQEGLGLAAYRTITGNRRHYGGMIVHLGILVMAIGFVGSGIFRSEASLAMAPGDVTKLSGYTIRFDDTRNLARANYRSITARFTVLEDNIVVQPERRNYPAQQMPTTEAGIHSTPARDIYVVISEAVGDKWAVQIYINPLVQLVWYGFLITLIGLVFTLSMRSRAARSRANVSAPLTQGV